MRKQLVIFLLIASVALPSFASAVLVTRVAPRMAADVQLEQRVITAVREKFGDVAAAHMWSEAHDGDVVLHGIFAQMMALQIANRIRRVEGVKTARWGAF